MNNLALLIIRSVSAALLLLVLPAYGDPALQTRLNLELADDVVIPAYRNLVESTNDLAESATSFCQAPDQSRFHTLRKQFQTTTDAWQTVQWLRKGPAEFAFRHRRLALWPDKHGTGARQVRKLLRDKDPAKLEADTFATGSVAVQGIPALERILFADEAPDNFMEPGKTYRCQYVTAITGNLQHIANALHNDWITIYRDAIASPGDDNSFFGAPGGVTAEFLSQLVTQLQFMLGQKLERPLGIDPSVQASALAPDSLHPRTRRAENWRSDRALKNIRINLAVLSQAYTIALKPLIPETETAAQIDDTFTEVEQRFAGLPDQLNAAFDTEPESLLQAWASLRRLYLLAEKDLPAALDIPLGFNALDGD